MTLYRIIYYDQEALRKGAKTEPVNFVGSLPLTWHESDVPEVGFIEMDEDEIKAYLIVKDKKDEEIIDNVEFYLAHKPA